MPKLRALQTLLAIAIAVSIVHYADNVANFSDYPDPSSGPAPGRTLIAISWFAFTAFAIAGYVYYRRERWTAAAGSLAVYSMSGLVGFGHYTVSGATDMPWWRQTHIVADILCGIAVIGFAILIARRRPQPSLNRTTPPNVPA